MVIAVSLVRAYLELNGYFVLSELPVRARGPHQAVDVTDLDILAVRFPHHPRTRSRDSTDALDIYLGLDPALDAPDRSVDVIVGEVKEGRAAVNPPLRRVSTIIFALRRLGCCPEGELRSVAQRILEEGSCSMFMAPELTCQVRLLAFAGYGERAMPGVRALSLKHCAEVIGARLRAAEELLGGLHFEDPVLGWFALKHKLGIS